MKRDTGGGGLVEIETGYEKAVSRSRHAVERNTSLLEVTVPIGVVRSLAGVRPLPTRRSARGSALMPAQPAPTRLRRIELALMTAIVLVLGASTIVAAL